MLLTNRIPVRVDPWRLVRSLEQQWGHNFGEWFDSAAQALGLSPVRIWTRDGQAVVEFDLPGHAPEEVQLSAERNVLTVHVEPAAAVSEGEYHIRERTPPADRGVQLPFVIDPQNTTAVFGHGVLRVTVHQRESDRPARIEVKGG